MGEYTVTMDNTLVATMDATNAVASHDVIMFFATNLDTSVQHTLTLTAKGGLVLDSFNAFGPQGGVGFV